MNFKDIEKRLKLLGNPEIAKHSQGFFKTGKGEYGEGDIFLGIRIPIIRQEIKKYKDFSLADTEKLLHSKYHEIRMFAVLLLVQKYKKNKDEQTEIFELYIKNRKYVNNWDLIDTTAPHIVGEHLARKDRSLLYEFSKSKILWERRIAIIATFHFIRNNEFADSLKISKVLLEDKEDLIHKAVGWMLREIGKRDLKSEVDFLMKYYKKMPRMMLRYAIEKFPKEARDKYLKGVL